MVYNVLFISETKLKDNTPITDNVDSSELRFAIQQAQTIQIQETLGTNLYDKLQQLVDTGDINLAGNVRYKALLDNYVQPTLIAFSYYLALDNFWVKFINIGLVQNRSEQGNPVDLKTLQYLKTNAENQAEFQNNLMRRHLIFRSGWYPEYNNGNLNDGQLPPQVKTAFTSQITMPGTSYYWGRNSSFNAMGPLCAGSTLPTWYGKANNS